MKKSLYILSTIIILLVIGIFVSKKVNLNPNYKVGQKIDSLNGIAVYYNGGVGNVAGREITKDGYNIGLKYQCVEFVKRYYFKELHHKMPDSYGNAKDFFNSNLQDGAFNNQRGLKQYINPSTSKPQVNDIIIYSSSVFNKYGHVSIVSEVNENRIEIIQQNPGPFGNSRENYKLIEKNGKWRIDHDRILGWLRK